MSSTPPHPHLHPPKHERTSSSMHYDYQKGDESVEELNKWLAEEKERERRACYRCRTMAQADAAERYWRTKG